MTNLKTRAGAIIASGAFVFSFVPGVFAASDVEVTISGNGAGSSQNVMVKDTSVETVKQSNSTVVLSMQSANSSTGGNKIVNSTGEGNDNSITTGDATAKNTVSVIGGSNTVIADPCACEPSTITLDITGNGADSNTTVKVVEKSKKKVKQRSDTTVYNEQEAKAKTGKNKIKNSTGTNGDTISTGDATTKNKVVVESGSNFIGPVDIL